MLYLVNSIPRAGGLTPFFAGITTIKNDFDNYDQHVIHSLLSIAAQLCLRLILFKPNQTCRLVQVIFQGN